MVSKAKIAANSRYNAKTYDVLSIRVQKAERINDLLDAAIMGKDISKAAYILGAIRDRLRVDGITIDTLPDTTTGE